MVRRAVFLDFDQTISTTHVWKLLGGKKDPSLLRNVSDDRLWGGKDRENSLRKLWKSMEDQGVDVHVISHNWRDIVESALKRADFGSTLSICGRETVRKKGVAVASILDRYNIESKNACFVDDDATNIYDVSHTCPGINAIPSPTSGLQEEQINHLLEWVSNPKAATS
eukprot:TRINITY_DN1442_c2_g1_i1.p1 TRINITY_DN1442_c2_g1~~TRINITY_DN1442_c2_g1_i1.p1  ORF type:complete len:184 (+),score=33.37 TRINITY_DN1442_c2_g1_i1:50-553(+)